MNTFERDFTKELEKCVQKGTAEIAVQKTWAPSRVAPPEVHVSAGLNAEVPIEAMHYQLRRNQTFQQISNLLGMSLSESAITAITKRSHDEEKIQVWMFARWWFNSYAEYLLEPLTQRSAFYKERHEEFLSLMRHMLEFQSQRRLTFRSALASWFPDSDLFTTEDQSEDDDESVDEPQPSALPKAPAVSEAVVVLPRPETVAAPAAPPPSPSFVAAPQTTAARRLVLKGWGDSAGRKKTRKNHGS
jgi:hypothetical protein